MKSLWRLLATLVLLLLVAAPVLAQGSFIFTDEIGNLDQGQIQRAAQPLINRGAVVAIYMVRNGSNADLQRRLQADNLESSDGRLRQGLIAIYVGLDNRFSAIRFEDRWNEALATNDNVVAIRNNRLNPGLAAGDFSQAYADTLGAIEEAIQSPPRPGGGNVFNVNLIPVVIGVFVLIGLFVVGGVIGRRRAAARALANARQQFTEAQQRVGSAIAEMGQMLRTADEKAQFDRVSYSTADVERLAQAQQALKQRFADAQVTFDDIGENLARYATPTVAQYKEAAQGYTQLQTQIAELRTQLDQINATRVELDRLAQQAPQEIDRAKKS